MTLLYQRLSHEVGWGYKDVVDRLEEKRKIKAQAYHERKVRPILIVKTTVSLLIIVVPTSLPRPSSARTL